MTTPTTTRKTATRGDRDMLEDEANEREIRRIRRAQLKPLAEAGVFSAEQPSDPAELSRTDNCEQCGKPTSFERRDPAMQPPEGEVCEQCQMWVCPDCMHEIGEPCPTRPKRWHYGKWPEGFMVFDGYGNMIAKVLTTEESAQGIVNALNTHAALVEALEQARQTINELTWNKKITGKTREQLSQVSEQAREALKQARGGE